MATFTLDTSLLGGSDLAYMETTVEDRGRLLQLEWNQGTAGQDLELYGYAVRYAPAEAATMTGQLTSYDGSAVAYIETIIEDRGRGVQIEWNQGGADQDIELFGHAIRYLPAETTSMDQS